MKPLEKLVALLNVKTIVTFVVIGVFCVLSLRGTIDVQYIMSVTTMVVAFYFGTQVDKYSGGKSA